MINLLKKKNSLCLFIEIAKVIILLLVSQKYTYSQNNPKFLSQISKKSIDTIMQPSERVVFFKNLEGKWGIINYNQKILAQPKYEIISSFKEGLTYFWVNLNYNGYLDITGKEVHKSSYSSIGDFEGGLGEVWLKKIGQKFNNKIYAENPSDVRRNFLDHSFKLLVPYKYDSVATYQAGKIRLVLQKGKYGFLGPKAQEIIPPILDDVDLDSAYYWNEYRRVRYKGRFGFLNTSTGQWFIKPKFKDTLPSTSSIVWVKDTSGWLLINKEQRPLIKQVYTQVHWVTPGVLAAAKTNQGFVLIDQLGRQLTSVGYNNIFMANEGISVVLKDGRYGYINEKGHEIASPIYEKASYFHNGKGFVFGKYTYLYIDRNGRETIDRLKPFVLIIGGLVICLFVLVLARTCGRIKSKKASI